MILAFSFSHSFNKHYMEGNAASLLPEEITIHGMVFFTLHFLVANGNAKHYATVNGHNPILASVLLAKV